MDYPIIIPKYFELYNTTIERGIAMKKIITFTLIATLMLTSTSTAFAKQNSNADKSNSMRVSQQEEKKKAKAIEKKAKEEAKLAKAKPKAKAKESPVIKHGRYQLPTRPITRGMKAELEYDKENAEITVKKGDITIVINLDDETVLVNGLSIADSEIFDNSNKTIVLIQYIEELLGLDDDYEDDDNDDEDEDEDNDDEDEDDEDEDEDKVYRLNRPTLVTVNTFSVSGSSVLLNTLNKFSLYMMANADITAGQATGGRAELYIGSRLVATDTTILVDDTKVTFVVPNSSTNNAMLQSAIPEGGKVWVRLYNSNNNYVDSRIGNPVLVVDYLEPSITNITSAIFQVDDNELYLIAQGAGAVGDKINVNNLTIYDSNNGKSYQLTNAKKGGSTGIVKNDKSLLIKIGDVDKLAMKDFGKDLYININYDALIIDAAGNMSANIAGNHTIPIIVID